MPDTTVTVRQDGTGDYTTVTSAEAAADISSGYYKIEIDDSNSYNEYVTISVSGTPSASNYVWVTASSGNRHSGVSSTTGHARIFTSSSGTYPLKIYENYTRVDYLELDRVSNGSGGIALQDVTDCVISHCIIAGDSNIGRGIWPYNGSGSSPSTSNHYIDNCVIHGWQTGIYAYQTESGKTVNLYVDYCSIADQGSTSYYYDVNIRFLAVYSGNTLNLYNTAMADAALTDYTSSYTNGGTGYGGTSNLTDVGSHNAWDNQTSYTTSNSGGFTSTQTLSGGLTTTTTTANAMIVTNTTSGSINFTPVVATGSGSNLLLGNGTNRIGSEPDSRQDFSTDIAGNNRASKAGFVDIGAFQITQAPAGFKYWDGSAWADSTAVQYYNGSAWVDVNAIQYWNGSAWTDPS